MTLILERIEVDLTENSLQAELIVGEKNFNSEQSGEHKQLKTFPKVHFSFTHCCFISQLLKTL